MSTSARRCRGIADGQAAAGVDDQAAAGVDDQAAADGEVPESAAVRLEWVDAGRGIAIILVVLVHSRDWLAVAGLDLQAWDQANDVLSGLRMPLFFVISGLLGSAWTAASWPQLLSRKITFLMWVYVAWQPIGLLAALVADRMTGAHVTVGHFLLALAASAVRPRSELWFLWALAVYFVLARACRRIRFAIQIGISGLVSAVWLSGLAPDGNLAWNGVIKFYPFFLLGVHHRGLILALVRRVERWPSLAVPLLLAWLVAAVTVVALGLDYYIGPALAVRVLGLLAGLALAARAAGMRSLRYLGARTLPIYLAHTPVIIVLAWGIHHARDDTWTWRITRDLAPALPLALTLVVVPLTLVLHAALRGTHAGVLYRPPARLSAAVATSVGWADRMSRSGPPDACDPPEEGSLTPQARGLSLRSSTKAEAGLTLNITAATPQSESCSASCSGSWP